MNCPKHEKLNFTIDNLKEFIKVLFKKKVQNIVRNFFFPDKIMLQLSTEEKRKRIYVFTVVAVSIPVLLVFGIMHYQMDGWLKSSWANFAITGLLSAIVLIARKAKDGRNAYRVGLAGISIFLLYVLALGLADRGDVLWFFIYPLVSFFIFGIVEGIIWIIMIMIPAFIIILFPSFTNAFVFSSDFILRFIVSIVIITFVAGLLESLRLYFYKELKKQKIELEIALQNVKTLSGLIPICATCKKIRDDKGYWQAVEQYISTHTDALFSHGICEDCLKKTEPEVYQILVDKGKIKPVKD